MLPGSRPNCKIKAAVKSIFSFLAKIPLHFAEKRVYYMRVVFPFLAPASFDFETEVVMVRPVTQDCYDAITMDEWPRLAAIVDFGLSDQQHYEALYDCIRAGEITIEQLEEVLGSGSKITELVNKCKSNRHKGIVFKTSWDDLVEEE